MSFFDNAIRATKLGYNLLGDAYDIGLENTLKLLGTDSAKQLGKGLVDRAGLNIKVQTNKDLSPDVIDEVRKSVVNALEQGRRGTEYEDYGTLPDGTSIKDFVTKDFARGGADVWKTIIDNPVAQAATTLGRGSIEIDDEGNVFYTDKYNFAAKGSNTGTDSYSELRRAAGQVLTEDEGETTGQGFRLYMGKEDELLGRAVKKGDTLSKIAKEMGYTVDELAQANNISNTNKIKIGQRIKAPTILTDSPIEEQLVSLDELLQGDSELLNLGA